MINVCGVSKSYRNGKKSVEILKDVHFTLPDSGLTFIIGKSGSGKTTLLNLLAGLDKVSGGEIWAGGKNIAACTDAELDAYRLNSAAFVFQSTTLLENLSVKDNIMLAVAMQGKTLSDEAVVKLLADVDLAEQSDYLPQMLSGGQAQRAAIAGALAKNTSVIFADEPTGNLDEENTDAVFTLLKKVSLTRQVVVVSHNIGSAKKYADSIFRILDQNVIRVDADLNILPGIQKEPHCKDGEAPPQETAQRGAVFSAKQYFSRARVIYKKAGKLHRAANLLMGALAIAFFCLAVGCSSFDPTRAHAQALADNKIDYIAVYPRADASTSFQLSAMDDAAFLKLSQKYGTPAQKIYGERAQFSIASNFENPDTPYFGGNVLLEKVIVAQGINDIRKTMYAGVYPTNDSCIAISRYLAEQMCYVGVWDVSQIPTKQNFLHLLFDNKVKVMHPETITELIGMPIFFNDSKFFISGIIDFDLSHFAYLKDKKIKNYGSGEALKTKWWDMEINIARRFRKEFVPNDVMQQSAFLNEAGWSRYLSQSLKRETVKSVTTAAEGLYVYSVESMTQGMLDSTTWADGAQSASNRLILHSGYKDRFPEARPGQMLTLSIRNTLYDCPPIVKEFLFAGVSPSAEGIYVDYDTRLQEFSSPCVGAFLFADGVEQSEQLLRQLKTDDSVSVRTGFSSSADALDEFLFYIKFICFGISALMLVFSVLTHIVTLAQIAERNRKDIAILRALGLSKKQCYLLLCIVGLRSDVMQILVGAAIFGVALLAFNLILSAMTLLGAYLIKFNILSFIGAVLMPPVLSFVSTLVLLPKALKGSIAAEIK